jgi:uncharacterized BrkB/YihY/UPF0761 family membrane protein
MNLGASEFVIIFLVGVIGLGLVVWAVADAIGRPAEAFQAAGSSRTTWIALPIVAMLFCGLGWLFSLIYLLMIRPKVAAAQGR